MRPGLLRSCLFTPADRWKVLKKAWVSNTDCMIIDMEDATAALESVKLQARENVRQFFDEEVATVRKDGREELYPDVVVRVNDLTTPWGRGDIESIASLSSPPTACLLPKAQNIAEIEAIGRDLPSSIALWVMIETAKAVQSVERIAQLPKVECLVFGSNDFSKDIGATLTQTREPLLYAMGRTICAAKSANKSVIDGVFMNLEDGDRMERGLRSQCIQGKEMGFTGKSLIHPKQVDITNEAWAPTPAEVDHASRVISCYHEAMDQGKGVAVLDGTLIEALHVDRAKQLLLNHMLVEKRQRK
jgi:citrate lyase beta subunit